MRVLSLTGQTLKAHNPEGKPMTQPSGFKILGNSITTAVPMQHVHQQCDGQYTGKFLTYSTT
eukprot:781428-Ditylum_brightwellii.AAC.1